MWEPMLFEANASSYSVILWNKNEKCLVFIDSNFLYALSIDNKLFHTIFDFHFYSTNRYDDFVGSSSKGSMKLEHDFVERNNSSIKRKVHVDTVTGKLMN